MELAEKRYGIIYSQICLPKSHGLSWLRWCNSPNLLPEFAREELFSIIQSLNTKWQDELVIKLDYSPLTTCLTKAGRTAEIAADIYRQMNNFIKKYSDLEDNIRIVWTECLLPENVEERPSAHQLGNYSGAVRVGQFLEKGDQVGIFEV
jgi:hypothetical protein